MLVISVASLFLVGCKDDAQPTLMPTAEAMATVPDMEQPPTRSGTEVSDPSPSDDPPTNIPPTPTAIEPMAATVNGRPIWLADFDKELLRFEQAQAELGISPADIDADYAEIVLEALIETELIAQAAELNGIVVTAEMVNERIVELRETAGGDLNFDAWLQANQWTVEEFHQALMTEMITEQMVNLITADVPFTMEQVHARYLQVDDPALAEALLGQVHDGADFAELAQQYSLDRITAEDGGDLGFFAQGSLLVPEVEVAAFALQPGEISEVVAAPRADGSGTAYYLVQLIERDQQRQITANLRSILLQVRFETWLADQWNQAEIIKVAGENQ